MLISDVCNCIYCYSSMPAQPCAWRMDASTWLLGCLDYALTWRFDVSNINFAQMSKNIELVLITPCSKSMYILWHQ